MSRPLSISEGATGIREGRLAPLEMVERCIERIRAYNDQIKAWVLVDEDGARRQAETLGKQSPRGPLHGIPIGIKDIVDVKGFPTRAGSVLRENHVAESDAPIVEALRRAGAIILGKTVTVQFACFDPSETRNPWDAERSPGGSSSGSAAAVAMGMCLGAIGTQTGGSLVRPASYCGIATCKPTFGRVSTDGVVPVSYHLDHPGPMARSVDDLKIMLSCIHDRYPGEPAEVSLPPRLGVLEQFFMEGADASVQPVVRATLDKLRAAGATIEPVRFADGFEQVQPMHRRIMAVEAAEYHREDFPARRETYGPKIAGLLDEGLTISGVDYAADLAQLRRYQRRVDAFLGELDVDALIMPATDTTAPPLAMDTTGTPKFQAPWSCAGAPVVSFPCGLADDRLPVAVQLVARADREAKLLEVAQWCQRQVEFEAQPPLLEAEGC